MSWNVKNDKIAVIGMGYVGMPLALEFAKYFEVVGFDINKDKINIYQSGIDPTEEVGDEKIKNAKVNFTYDENCLKDIGIFIIAVPTPVNQDGTPNLQPVISASEIISKYISKDCLIIYESTVYPGATENICVPILEKGSSLKMGEDFKVGYSPERINPGDKEHRLVNICKIVSACDFLARAEMERIYKTIIDAEIYKATSIKVAEAAKLAENTQRDVNIAFMNELAMAFDRMGIDTIDVVNAMNTKWNALRFYPGLVGGHCIGVDPYYFIYEANMQGYNSNIVSGARRINDGMAEFVVNSTVKVLTNEGVIFPQAKIYILGATFKENCPDIRNSKIKDIIKYLEEYGINPILVEPVADTGEIIKEFGKEPVDINSIDDADCLIVAVAHDEIRNITSEKLDNMYKKEGNSKKILIDIKSVFDKEKLEEKGYRVWRL